MTDETMCILDYPGDCSYVQYFQKDERLKTGPITNSILGE